MFFSRSCSSPLEKLPLTLYSSRGLVVHNDASCSITPFRIPESTPFSKCQLSIQTFCSAPALLSHARSCVGGTVSQPISYFAALFLSQCAMQQPRYFLRVFATRKQWFTIPEQRKTLCSKSTSKTISRSDVNNSLIDDCFCLRGWDNAVLCLGDVEYGAKWTLFVRKHTCSIPLFFFTFFCLSPNLEVHGSTSGAPSWLVVVELTRARGTIRIVG